MYYLFSLLFRIKETPNFTSPAMTRNAPNLINMLFTQHLGYAILSIGGGLTARRSVLVLPLTYVLTDYDKYCAYD